MENGERPSPREEAGSPPFPMEPRREWHEMVAIVEVEKGGRIGEAPSSGECWPNQWWSVVVVSFPAGKDGELCRVYAVKSALSF